MVDGDRVSADDSPDDSTLPLHGIRVVEMASTLAGPYAASLLQSLGAQIVKVEPMPAGDVHRRYANGAHFAQINAGKTVYFADLRDEEHIARLMVLIAESDVLLTSGRANWLDTIGLGDEELRRLNPELVVSTLTGYGSIGPYAERPGWDLTAQAVMGLLSPRLAPGDESIPLGAPAHVDMVAGIVVAAGTLAALVRALTKRAFVRVETSLLEAAAAITTDAVTLAAEPSVGDWSNATVPQVLIFMPRTSEGGRVLLCLGFSEPFYNGMISAIDAPEVLEDPRFANYQLRMQNFAELNAIVNEKFLTRTADEWVTILTALDVPHAKINRWDQVVANEQVTALELYDTEAESPVPLFRGPWRFDGRRPTRNSTIEPKLFSEST